MIEHDEFAAHATPFSGRGRVIRVDDLARMIAAHARLRAICARLEAYADALPVRPADAVAHALCRDLRAVIVSYPRDEDAVIDALFDDSRTDPLTAAVVGRLRARHGSDAIQADDILAALSGVTVPCAEALGYMLRSFFEGCRLAMDFMQLAVLTLGGGRLTLDARDMLVRGLCARGVD